MGAKQAKKLLPGIAVLINPSTISLPALAGQFKGLLATQGNRPVSVHGFITNSGIPSGTSLVTR
jgi:hypothetical protein